MAEREYDKHWHLDRRINLGHLATTLSIVVAAMVWGSSVETRLSLGTQEREQQTKILEDIREEQKEMNRKMDGFLQKLYESRNKK